MSTSPKQAEVIKSSTLSRWLRSSVQQLFAFGALVLVYLYFLWQAPNFSSSNVLPDILLQSAAIGVMALGATFIIATGGIDLSVGTGTSLCAVMAGMFMGSQHLGLPLIAGIPLTLLIGALLGLVNGLNIAVLDIPPFIATLAMMLAAQGLTLVISDKKPVAVDAPGYLNISQGYLVPFLQNASLIFLVLTAIAAFLLTKTLIGRLALAMGSNEDATRLSGVRVKLWKVLVYVLAGVFTAMGAILSSARFGLASPNEGLGMELQAIAAVVIGGTSLSGGRANVIGTMIGTLLMSTLVYGLTVMGVQNEWQKVITGVVVLFAVFADNVRRKRAAGA